MYTDWKEYSKEIVPVYLYNLSIEAIDLEIMWRFILMKESKKSSKFRKLLEGGWWERSSKKI